MKKLISIVALIAIPYIALADCVITKIQVPSVFQGNKGEIFQLVPDRKWENLIFKVTSEDQNLNIDTSKVDVNICFIADEGILDIGYKEIEIEVINLKFKNDYETVVKDNYRDDKTY